VALPVLPAPVFEEEKSLLLVPMGCLGGDGHSHAAEAQACGSGYSATTPTASLVAIAMSRLTAPDKVALQVVHASAAMSAVDVQLTPGFNNAAGELLAPALSLGAIGPFPPFLRLADADYGALPQVELRTFEPSTTTPTSTLAMTDVLAHSDVAPTDFADGRGFVLVAVGAAPGAPGGGFWHPLTYTMLKADP
jgi:hypothetical protein